MSDSTHEEAHTGPIKTPKQLLLAVFFSFVVPVFIIIGLVAYVTSEPKPAGSASAERQTLGGVSADAIERGITERLRKVGTVEIRDANRPLATGETVYNTQCVACHGSGAAGAPKLGDNAAWAARIKTGFDALVASALKGKGAMAAQGGGDFQDVEIARAVAYMANAAGGKFEEPKGPAGAAAAEAPAAAAAPAAPTAAATPASYRRSISRHRLPRAVVARRCTSRPAWPVTPLAWRVRPSSVTRPLGRRAWRRACRPWCSRSSRARVPCPPRVGRPHRRRS